MRHRLVVLLLPVVLATVACAHVVPPREAAPVADRYAHTPFDTAWHRAIVYFANEHVPIQTIDKSSGLLVSSRFQLPFSDLKAWGDCGTASTGGSTIARLEAIHNYPTTSADFNVVMQPAGDSTSVRVSLAISGNVHVATGGLMDLQCVSNGQFERGLFDYVSGQQPR
jgi:hypothetical protein